ncbi:MAG: ATP-dependent DNA helicase RecG [Phycisphaerae bacterium]|nr:MAG: ATP-dependent DNA helicase RecG [Phycisphaerae bacterium]
MTTGDASLSTLCGVGPTRLKALKELGITTKIDLLEYFPRRYQLETAERPVAELVTDLIQNVRGEITAVDYIAGASRSRFEATLRDESGSLALVWFNGGYLKRVIHPGQQLRVKGKVRFFRGLPQMTNPKWSIITDETPAIEKSVFKPIYPASSRISSDTIAQLIHDHLSDLLELVDEWFEDELLQKYNLLPRKQAYRLIHVPGSHREAAQARRRLVFDELMLLQLGLVSSRQLRDGRLSAPVLRIDKTLDERIRSRFPFEMTRAQLQAAYQIAKDLQQRQPMNRLLQGDVGSGKTVVALYAMLMAVANRLQVAMLAPTEVLAEQHYLNFSRMLEGSNVRIGRFTGRSKRTEKDSIRRLATGQIHIAVGTQALIQQDIEFANLGLVVIDEQHKLGVHQRSVLQNKGYAPHYLVMTATPIPRTLALSYFADFDVTTIDELPPGRQPITTRFVRRHQASSVYQFVRQQISAGRQAYVVVPQIEDNEEDTASLLKKFDELKSRDLTGLRMEMLHGRISPDDRDRIMQDFRAGNVDVLLATTVIEVGIDVPNATVIVIESAERFGLSQLHQLRGRVGRGEHPSYCFLVSDAVNEEAIARLTAMTEMSNGFEIAEADLKLRGPGQFFGTRQHGLPELKLTDISQEIELLTIARKEAAAVLESDPGLQKPVHKHLREALIERFGDSIPLARVG